MNGLGDSQSSVGMLPPAVLFRSCAPTQTKVCLAGIELPSHSVLFAEAHPAYTPLQTTLGTLERRVPAYKMPSLRSFMWEPLIGFSSYAVTKPVITVTEAAQQLARKTRCLGALMLIGNFLKRHSDLVEAVFVDSHTDPESGDSLLCFDITSSASVESSLALDEALRQFMYEQIGPEQQVYFAITFQFS